MSTGHRRVCLEARSDSGLRVLAHVGPCSPAEAAVALEAAASPDRLDDLTRSYLAGDLEDGELIQSAHEVPGGRTVQVTVEAPTVLSAVAGLRALGSPSMSAQVMAGPYAAAA